MTWVTVCCRKPASSFAVPENAEKFAGAQSSAISISTLVSVDEGEESNGDVKRDSAGQMEAVDDMHQCPRWIHRFEDFLSSQPQLALKDPDLSVTHGPGQKAESCALA